MKQIELTQGKVALVDDGDFAELDKHKWHYNHGGSMRYAHRRKGDKIVSMHREILCAKKGEYVDHINGDSLDNRRFNMRICTNAENGRNSKLSKANKSGYKGVGWNKSRCLWRARITLDKKGIELGFHVCPLKASRLYDDAAKKYFGEFARLNDARMNCTDLGKALEVFREVTKHFNHEKIAKLIQEIMAPESNWYCISYPERHFFCKLIFNATTEQIWEINCLAKENESE